MEAREPTPYEEAYCYWLACRIMGIAIRRGRQTFVMNRLRRLFRMFGRPYYERSRPEMAEDIRRLGERLAKRLAESPESNGNFRL